MLAPRAATDIFEEGLKTAVVLRDRSRLTRWLHRPINSSLPYLISAMSVLRPTPVELFFGGHMMVILPEPVSNHLYRYGYYEAGLTAAMIRLLKQGDTFLDVGSHFGYLSLLACALVGANGRVVAFEPTPFTQAILRGNLADHPEAKVEPCALWRATGTIMLNDFGPVSSAYNSFTDARSYVPSTVHRRRILVPAITLDDYVQNARIRPDFIKIDAESAEMAIIQGAAKTLSTHRPIVTLEVGDFDVPGAPRSRELVLLMNDLHYHAYNVEGLELKPHRLLDRYNYDNLIFLPRPLEQMYLRGSTALVEDIEADAASGVSGEDKVLRAREPV
jgi:FkbM family methyltransferase